jgi:hypothetical protein
MISSNKISSTAKGSATGGKGDLHFPQRPVLAKYLAGIRLIWPQWLQARTTGKKDLHHTNRRHSLDVCAVPEVYSANQRSERRAPIRVGLLTSICRHTDNARHLSTCA